MIDLFTPLNHWGEALQYTHLTDKPLSYLSVSQIVEIADSRRKSPENCTGTLANHRSTMLSSLQPLWGSLFLLCERQDGAESGTWRGWWRVQGATRGHSGAFSACRGQALWSVRAASQAGLCCWHVWDLQLSAGEICTAETAAGGRRATLGIWPLGSREAWSEVKEKNWKKKWLPNKSAVGALWPYWE